MSEPQKTSDRPAEQEAVRTTIVGGRPPGSGQSVGPIPRGIEVLVMKAAVDPQFKQLLLERRAAAAEAIELKLDPSEEMMLDAIPAEQFETIIARTNVSQQHRRVFLGQAAAAMLATLGVAAGCGDQPQPRGIRPDSPDGRPHEIPLSDGIRPDPVEPIEPDDPVAPVEPADPVKEKSEMISRGVRPDRIPAPTGSRPDLPDISPGAEPRE